MSHYEFTGEQKTYDHKTVYRIRAVKTFKTNGDIEIAAGTLGGWIATGTNLKDSAWVADEAVVLENAVVSHGALVKGDAVVRGNARVCGNAVVFDRAEVRGSACVTHNCMVGGKALVEGEATLFDDAWVMGNAWVSGTAKLFKNAMVAGDVWIKCGSFGTGAYILRPNDWLCVGPLDNQGSLVTFYASVDDDITVRVGVDELSLAEYRSLCTTKPYQLAADLAEASMKR